MWPMNKVSSDGSIVMTDTLEGYRICPNEAATWDFIDTILSLPFSPPVKIWDRFSARHIVYMGALSNWLKVLEISIGVKFGKKLGYCSVLGLARLRSHPARPHRACPQIYSESYTRYCLCRLCPSLLPATPETGSAVRPWAKSSIVAVFDFKKNDTM